MRIHLRTLLKQSSALTSTIVVSALLAQPVIANPQGGDVAAGAATITTPDPSTLLIDQSTDRAIINWDSFNVDAGETTQFALPNADAWTLNRVVGSQSPSLIHGSIASNGNIVIVNPDGMHFGAGSTVDVNRFIATTADITNEDFMAGQLSFGIAGNPSASIVNEGVISAADYGFAALVAPSIRNSGVITARLGTVGLSAGNTFTIDPYGDGLIKLAIGDEIADEVYDVSTGEAVSDLVLNEGTLSADGGTVAMTSAVAREAVNSVVNNTGVVEARSVDMQNGMIVLGGATSSTKPAEAPTQTVQVSGTLDASVHDALYPIGVPVEGGHIQITGEAILGRDANIDASGDNGGGTVLIGGDYLGGNIEAQEAIALGALMEDGPIDTASLVALDDRVSISADATEAGDGGKVIIWSDDVTLTAAEITARGGAESGDGGFIETSGKNYLSVLTTADASATNGEAGTWLMDPVDIRIVDGLDQFTNILPNQFLGQMNIGGTLVDVYADFYVPVDQYDGLGNPVHSSASLIDAATIESALNSGTAVFITNVDSVGDDAGTISIEADINKTAGGDSFLGFNAVDDISIASGVDITSTSGSIMLSFASANGQIRGDNIGFIHTNGGVTLLAAPEGADVSSAGFISNPGNPSALQIDIQNYPSSAGSYNLTSAGQGFVNFAYNATTANFGQDAITLGGNPISLQIIMDHNAVLADGAITDTSQSQIVFLFIDPSSTMTAAQPGNNVAEIASNGIIAVGSQAGVGGELNVLPVLEVADTMNPATQCAGITCVPVTPVVVPPEDDGLQQFFGDLALKFANWVDGVFEPKDRPTFTYNNGLSPEAQETVWEYLEAIGIVGDGIDAIDPSVLDQYSSTYGVTWWEIFGELMAAEEIGRHLRNGDYEDALESASKYSALKLLSQSQLGGSILDANAIGSLAGLFVKVPLTRAVDLIADAGFEDQYEAYKTAREEFGYSHSELASNKSRDGKVHYENGYIHMIYSDSNVTGSDYRVGSPDARYSPSETFDVFRVMYEAEQAASETQNLRSEVTRNFRNGSI